MTKLTQKKVKFEWGDKQEAAFKTVKQNCCKCPIPCITLRKRRFSSHTATLQKRLWRCFDAKGNGKQMSLLIALSRKEREPPFRVSNLIHDYKLWDSS
ncbi:hypothetical protein Tco_1408722 [Tanacetum coccineum]